MNGTGDAGTGNGPGGGVAGSDLELDARQLSCPLPILRTKRSLSQLASGQVLRVLATDPGSPGDFEMFCRQTGNELLSSAEEGGEFVFLIRRR